VLDTLFREWQPSDAEIGSLFREAQEVQAAVSELSPELVPVEKDWFAGMHESPFAFRLDAVRGDEEG
jgi:hypothetical protein